MKLKNNFFSLVPACRFATFRTLVAVVNLALVLPRWGLMLKTYVQFSFHDPMLVGLPALTPGMVPILIACLYLANYLLLFGILPRISAGAIALIGAYIFALDSTYYSNGTLFHLILLFILAVSKNPLSTMDLFDEKKREMKWTSWPEHLVRYQLVIILFYSALDKMLSPYWQNSGTFFVYELTPQYFLKLSVPLLAAFQTTVTSLILSIPGIFSLFVIGLELSLSAAILWKPFWKPTKLGLLFFIIGVEFLVNPGLFTWDLAACLILFLPTRDKTGPVLYGKLRLKKILSEIDWLGQLSWTQVRSQARPGGGLRAFRSLLIHLPVLLFFIFALVRFAPLPHLIPPRERVFLIIGIVACLWMPGIAELADFFAAKLRITSQNK